MNITAVETARVLLPQGIDHRRGVRVSVINYRAGRTVIWEIGLTVSVAVMFSLLIARFLTPVMAAYSLVPRPASATSNSACILLACARLDFVKPLESTGGRHHNAVRSIGTRGDAADWL